MASAPGAPSGDSAIHPILVGRDRERVILHEELSLALQGRGRLVFLGGEAGIGKTTLAGEVVRDAVAKGARILEGHCYDLSAVPPYGPWLDLALAYSHGQGGNEPALPHAFAGGRLAPIESQSALFAETLDFLATLSREGPVLLLLEDLHWADAASLELLRFVAGRVASLPILALVTYRVDELTRRHPLYRQLPDLVRAGAGLRIDLKRLDAAALRGLVRAGYELGAQDEARLCAYLDQQAQGNPFFATELLRALDDEGVIARGPGTTTLGPLDRVVLPHFLTQVIDARIDRLGEEARRRLAVAAVIGQEVPLPLWGEVARASDDELLALLERAIDAHVLTADQHGDRVRFVHALTRESLYQSTLPARRRTWHGAVADALIARPDPDPDAVAFHLQQAGDERAAEWLVRAGNRAQRAYRWLEAAERLVAAAEAMAARSDLRRERGWLLFRAARLRRLAQPEQGLAHVRAAIALAEAIGDRLLAAEGRSALGLLLCYSNAFGEGLQTVAGANAELEALPQHVLSGDEAVVIALADSLPRVEADGARDLSAAMELQRRIGMHHRRAAEPWHHAAVGYFAHAEHVALTFVPPAAALDNPGAVVRSALGHALQGLAIVQAATGRLADARASFAASRGVYRAIDHDGLIVLCCLSELGWVALDAAADEPAYRRRIAAEAVAAFGNAGGALAPGLLADVCRVGIMAADGQWDEAVTLVDAMREVAPTFGNSFIAAEAALTQAEIARHRGDHAAVARELAAWFPEGPGAVPGDRLYRQSLALQRHAAELAAERGDIGEADAWLRANEQWLDWAGCAAGRAAHELAWAVRHRAVGDTTAARGRATAALEGATDPPSPVTRLRAHRTLGEIHAAAGDAAAARHHLLASLELATRCELPFERALGLTALLELDAHTGRSAAGDPRTAEAEATLRRLGARPALDRLRTVTATPAQAPLPFGLSPREAEVLRLLARGLTDRAIGERLFISERTASKHVQSIFGKLGVTSRAAATRFAVEHGLV